MTEETPEPSEPPVPSRTRPRRSRRAKLEPEALAPSEPAPTETEAPAAEAAAVEPAATAQEPGDLPAVPHPALMPARPGTPPPPPGPPGTYVVEQRPPRPRSNAQLTFGIVLVVFGVIAMLNAFGLLWWIDGRLIWPVVLIAAGLILIYRRGLR